MKRWSVLFLSLCLVFLSLGAACAETLTVGGNHDIGDQLRVSVDDFGNLYADLWQEYPGVPGNSEFLQQYFSNFRSYLFLDYGTASQDVYTNGSFQQESHVLAGDDTVESVFSLGETGVEITQKISYETGKLYYRKEWQVTNNGSRAYSNLRFLHGGDTYFSYYDSSEGHWDPTLRMVFLTNNANQVAGIMGMYGALSSPADHYYESGYSSNWSYMSSGQLPDTVLGTYHDAGYSLQWNHDSLEPGETWTIVAFEKWTEAGDLQVFAPADQECQAGETLYYDFVIQNYYSSNMEVSLDLVSEHDWDVSFDIYLPEGDFVSSATGTAALPVGGSLVVNAQVTVPAVVAGGTEDDLTLTATAIASPDITNSDSVTSVVLALGDDDDDDDGWYPEGKGSGCNMGLFSPGLLLLLAPILFMKKNG